MEKACPECGMIGFHKLSCSQPHKNRASLRENWEKLKEIEFYKHLDKIK